MIEDVVLEWNKGVLEKLTHTIPDRVVYEVAAMTLDLAYPTIPERTGRMRETSKAKGVQGSDREYWIGSYTDYAAYVYNMGPNTNWTTPGTNAYWFKECWQKNGNSILSTVLERVKE